MYKSIYLTKDMGTVLGNKSTGVGYEWEKRHDLEFQTYSSPTCRCPAWVDPVWTVQTTGACTHIGKHFSFPLSKVVVIAWRLSTIDLAHGTG